mmetsp:Transcript_34985/g.61452  ORF Transcript_34985/g.61452 Transcript_34985/m.61452 type:complete len:85 (-) Transcript_34985:759-1013(-)
MMSDDDDDDDDNGVASREGVFISEVTHCYLISNRVLQLSNQAKQRSTQSQVPKVKPQSLPLELWNYRKNDLKGRGANRRLSLSC